MWFRKFSFTIINCLLFIRFDGIQCDLIGRMVGGLKGLANNVACDVASFFSSKLCQMDTYQMINYYGYRAERHCVCTEDGYKLTLFRANAKNSTMCNKRVVIIVHGITASSDDFCNDPPGHGMTYILASAGYDVWLINCRGNTFSRGHTHRDPDDPLSGFWKFSWHDMALKDFPACINYIRKCTKQNKVYWVAHSQGTSATMALLSEKPEYNQYMQVVCLLAPVGYLNNSGTPYRSLAAIQKPLQLIENVEFLPRSPFSYIAGVQCQGLGSIVCEQLLKALMGQSKDETNQKMMPIHMCHYPSGSSSTQFSHFGQEIKHGYFGKPMTGNTVPCDFQVHRISAPLMLQYSTCDTLGDSKDVERLIPKLTGSCDLCINKITKPFNHADFIWGNNAPKLVYAPMLQFFDKHCKN